VNQFDGLDAFSIVSFDGQMMSLPIDAFEYSVVPGVAALDVRPQLAFSCRVADGAWNMRSTRTLS
jgi:hypothetical protein